jgi:hypothetical protein
MSTALLGVPLGKEMRRVACLSHVMLAPPKEHHLMPGNALGDRSQPERGEDL